LAQAVAVGFCLAAQLVALCSQLRSQLRSDGVSFGSDVEI